MAHWAAPDPGGNQFFVLFFEEDNVETLKNVTVNSITNNGKRSYANIFKTPKKNKVKEGERKDILMQNMQK